MGSSKVDEGRTARRCRAGETATNRNRPSGKVMRIKEVDPMGSSHGFWRPWQCKPARRCKTKEKDGGGRKQDPTMWRTRGESGATQTKDKPGFRQQKWRHGPMGSPHWFRRPWQCKPARRRKTKEKDGGGGKRDPTTMKAGKTG